MAEFEYIVNTDLPLVAICEYGGGFTKGTAAQSDSSKSTK